MTTSSDSAAGQTGLRSLVGRATALAQRLNDWWQGTRPGRALGRFNAVSGSLLCGGLAYSALFSVFAGLTIAYSVLSVVLRGRPEALQTVLDAINDAVPGLIDTGQGGALKPDQLLLGSGSVVASIVAAAVLLWSAISFMGGLRSALRAVFDRLRALESFVLAKLRELGGFVVLVVGVALSSVLSIVAARFGSWAADLLGWTEVGHVLVPVLGFLLAGLVDLGVVVYVLAVLGEARASRRDLLWGSAAAAVVLGVLRFLGTSVVAGAASKNVLLASFAVVVTLLLLVNFVSRVLLMVAAWVADPPRAVER